MAEAARSNRIHNEVVWGGRPLEEVKRRNLISAEQS
jgi:hypothetical protein